MTVKEFFSEKNISKDNPFEDLTIKQTISMEEYKDISDLIVMFAFNDNKEYLPLTKEFSYRFAVMVVYLGLNIDDSIKPSDIFTPIMCTDIFDRFVAQLSYPTQLDSIRKSIDDFTNYAVSNNIILSDICVRIKDMLNVFSDEKTVQRFIELIGVDIMDKLAIEVKEDDINGTT